jgi:hypothetical protein
VFVSYARSDSSRLAEELVTALELLQFDGYLDRHDIVPGEEWERRLDMLIREADTILFIISPRSVCSSRCAWEIDRATALAKRIVPVVGVAVDDSLVPSALQRLNYIHFTENDSFARSLGQLAGALRHDIEWVREHTRLGELARRWDERGRPESLLLRGDEVSSSQAWREHWAAGSPELTDLHREFIAESADAAERRELQERERINELARANAERADALQRREEALVLLRRRTLIAGAGTLSLATVIGGGGLYTYGVLKRAEEAERKSFDNMIREEARRTDISGQIVAYAASFGEPAMDTGPGGQSPYTSALLNQLESPTVSLWTALSRASTDVARYTGGRQRPFISSTMNGDVYPSIPSKSSRRNALIVAVGRVANFRFEGVYRDVGAWSNFLSSRGFEVVGLRDPTKAEFLASFTKLRFALHEGYSGSLGRVGLRLPDDEKSAKPEAPGDTFSILFYSGLGFRFGKERLIALADTKIDGLEASSKSAASCCFGR